MSFSTSLTRGSGRGGFAALMHDSSASHGRASLLLVIVALLAFLPGFFQIPPVDRDESRVALNTRQMLEAGDSFGIRSLDAARAGRPAGIHWLQAAWVKGLEAAKFPRARTTIWIYRMPSLLGAIGAVLLTYWAALPFVSRRGAILSGLMMATSLLLGVQARLAMADAAALAATVLAMGVMARAYLGDPGLRKANWPGRGMAALFWIALAAGLLIDGPPIALVTGFAAVTLVIVDRSIGWIGALRPLTGVPLMLLLLAPWLLATLDHAGFDQVVATAGADLYGKLFGATDGEGTPPGYHLLLYWLTFWPAATLTLLALPSVWAARHERGARFLLAWLVPAWLAFELFVSKEPSDVLPLYPAIAILIAGVVEQGRLSRTAWLERGTLWWLAVPMLLGLGGIAALMIVGRQLGLLAWPLAAAAIIAGFLAWRLYEDDGAERAVLRAMAASVLLSGAICAVILPTMRSLFPSAAVARVLRGAGCPSPQLAAAGYHEPSLVFQAGPGTVLTDGAGAADFLRQGGCRFALIEQRSERAFLRRAEAIGLRYAPGPRIEGFNLASGRALSLAVFRADGD